MLWMISASSATLLRISTGRRSSSGLIPAILEISAFKFVGSFRESKHTMILKSEHEKLLHSEHAIITS